MSVAYAADDEERDDRPHEDHFVHLHGISWADYERLLEMRGDRSAPRVQYLDGVVEIMSPSQRHEGIKGLIGALLEVWALEVGVELTTFGSWTLKKEERKAGVEPDECYVVGPRPYDAARPDLAIEVIWKHGGLDKLEIYARLGVPEIWVWRKRRLRVFALRVDGTYAEAPRSVRFPALDLELLASFLDRDTTTAAQRAYRDALRG